jgi:Tfp pilus assembly protein PilZ
VGVSLYFVSRGTWYVFLFHSGLVFLDFVIKWIAQPLLMLRTIPPLNNLLILAGNLILVALIGYVIQRDFRAPYFQALQRSFREHKRVPIRHNITLNGEPARIDDLSITGCFVPGTHPHRVGEEVTVSFRSETLTLAVKGRIMRETAYGLGIRFHALGRREKKDIARLLKNRYALRYKADLPAEWSVNHAVHPGRLFDVSTTGCFLAAEVQDLSPGASVSVAVGVGSTDIVARGRIVWVNPNGEHYKPQGFGLRFSRPQRRIVRLVRSQLGGLEQTR